MILNKIVGVGGGIGVGVRVGVTIGDGLIEKNHVQKQKYQYLLNQTMFYFLLFN